jgi:hypothetical protein
MTNWSRFNGGMGSGAQVTTWNYDGQRGWLKAKWDDDGTGPACAKGAVPHCHILG